MTDSPQPPEQGIADALTGLSEQTRRLLRQELDATQREMWERAKGFAPALLLASLAGVAASFTLVSGYTWTLRLLERRLPPATAAFVATTGYGGLAAAAAVGTLRRVQAAPAPFPTEAAERTAGRMADAVERAGEQGAY